MISKKEYEEILEDRPDKFAPDEVDFRRATGKEPRCDECLHYFRRAVDGHAVCEIMRPLTVTEMVLPEMTCDYQTPDGESFPLLHEDSEEATDPGQ